MNTLGKYQLKELLGQGGMAQVYRAESYGASGFVRHVALKVLLPPHRGVAELERLMIEEARLGAQLRHRNLVAVHELFVADGTYVVCMELVDGDDLSALLGRAPVPLGLALLIVEELAIALDYIHAAGELGLVHRDISPSNILLSRAGEVKLADLGIAKATTRADITQGNVRKGKYAYMSPEQVAGVPLQSTSDLFSLGIVLYQLVCGRRPFDADTALATMDNIKRADRPSMDEVPPALEPIIARCLARDPDMRYPSAADVQQQLAAIRRTMPPESPLTLGRWVQQQLG